ncbi:ABC-F family ATP-binding cassette domain-containing protein [Peptoniphilus sp. AGMB00490]|uniref:ABC-F family ATP-binding cassette domain-containing protein n=1 Tax=Peptoniphilus faecalis TaxID=2731255 RepID=A0A848RJD8_9FIRM|nr:ABC-F family ATP-binding cassette domain-containing protein [Peptoniphilus faecalis]NMW84432.1 ABC-F family ATP-binding cassette domain-containing protein [Peptoniphilus faecalis]
MPILSLTNIKKSYIDEETIKDANLIVEEEDKIGLIGINGSGKSTLFNIITENLSYDDGEIFRKKDLKIGYLEQQLNLNQEGSIYDNCLFIFRDLIELEKNLREQEHIIAENPNNLEEELNRYQSMQDEFHKRDGYSFHSRIRGTLIGLGFSEEDFDRDISTLSGGQKSRVALAMLLLEDADLLLLDEPTNHLDIDAISWLEKYLKDVNKAIIIISHDRYFLNNIVSKIVLMEKGETKTYSGNYDNYMRQRKKDFEVLKRQYDDQQKEIKRQEEIIKRYLSLGRDRFIKQGKSRKKMLDKMQKIEMPSSNKKTSLSFTTNKTSGKDVLEIKNLSKSFGDHLVFHDLNASVYKNDKIGLIGPNGVGKSTLFKIIAGKIRPDSGEVKIGSNVEIAFFYQELDNLNLNNTVLDEIWDEFPKLEHFQVRKYLAEFLFVGDDIFKTIDELSGGERGRLSLLKIMLKGANFLVLDEPTNHLDIDSKEILEDALLKYEGTVLSISHDRYFLNKTVDKIFEMKKDAINTFLGNYDYYLEKTTEVETFEDSYKSKTEIARQKREEREERKKNKELRREKEKIENEIADIEEKLSTIDEKLANSNTYKDYQLANDLSIKRETLANTLDKLYEIWMELEEN